MPGSGAVGERGEGESGRARWSSVVHSVSGVLFELHDFHVAEDLCDFPQVCLLVWATRAAAVLSCPRFLACASAASTAGLHLYARVCTCMLSLIGHCAHVSDDGRLQNPAHLVLDHVLEREQGHPLLLALVYRAVAARLGLHLSG